MKRQNWMMVVMVMVLLTGVCAIARADGTIDNWSVKLMFSTDSKADLLPVSIGESTLASQLLKPPPFPGQADTGDATDALVNAYILKTTDKASREVYQVDSTAPGRAWVVNVDTEQEGAPVYVTPDLSKFFFPFKLYMFDPTAGKRIDLRDANGAKVTSFTSDSSGSRTLFLISGDSGTMAVAKGTEIKGVSMVNGVYDVMPEGAKVYVDGSNTESATVNADGLFTITGLSAGNHTIKIKMTGKLSTAGTVNVSGEAGYGTPVVLKDMYAGDICCEGEDGSGGDNQIDTFDFAAWKSYYGLSKCGSGTNCACGAIPCNCKPIRTGMPQVCYLPEYDLDGNGVIDGEDFGVFKEGYGKKGAD